MAEAMEYQRPLRSGEGVERTCQRVRAVVERLTADRPPARAAGGVGRGACELRLGRVGPLRGRAGGCFDRYGSRGREFGVAGLAAKRGAQFIARALARLAGVLLLLGKSFSVSVPAREILGRALDLVEESRRREVIFDATQPEQAARRA